MRYRITNKKKFIILIILIILIIANCFIFFLGIMVGYNKKPVVIEQIVAPISVTQFIDQATMTPITSIPELDPRYGFTEDEIKVLAILLCGSKDVDGDGEYDIDFGNDERYDQISLVLCVVMNRVRNDHFPNTVTEVVYQPNQFAPMKQWKDCSPEVSEIALQRVREWCNAYDCWDSEIQSIPEDHLYFTGDGLENHSSTTW